MDDSHVHRAADSKAGSPPPSPHPPACVDDCPCGSKEAAHAERLILGRGQRPDGSSQGLNHSGRVLVCAGPRGRCDVPVNIAAAPGRVAVRNPPVGA